MYAFVGLVVLLTALFGLGVWLDLKSQKEHDAWIFEGARAVCDLPTLLAWLAEGREKSLRVNIKEWPYWERPAETCWRIWGVKNHLLLFLEDGGRISTRLIGRED